MIKGSNSVLLLSLFLLLFSILSMAQEAPAPLPGLPPTEEGETALESTLVESLSDTIRPFFLKASVLVGGIFGVYVIMVIARIHYERKKVKLLEQIRYDLDQLNQHYKIPSSRERVGPFRRVWRWLHARFGRG